MADSKRPEIGKYYNIVGYKQQLIFICLQENEFICVVGNGAWEIGDTTNPKINHFTVTFEENKIVSTPLWRALNENR
jgi:hypothetical protein